MFGSAAGVEAPTSTQAEYTARGAQARWHTTVVGRGGSASTASILPPEASCGAASQPLQRFRLAHWQALGAVPAELPGATVARGYRLAYGRPPARDPERRASCAYSRRELAEALAALGYRLPCRPAPPPPADPLELIWRAALLRLQLPSTRLLLAHHGRLLQLRDSASPLASPGELVAEVAVRSMWWGLAAGRVDLIGNALGEVLGRVVAVDLLEAGR